MTCREMTYFNSKIKPNTMVMANHTVTIIETPKVNNMPAIHASKRYPYFRAAYFTLTERHDLIAIAE